MPSICRVLFFAPPRPIPKILARARSQGTHRCAGFCLSTLKEGQDCIHHGNSVGRRGHVSTWSQEGGGGGYKTKI